MKEKQRGRHKTNCLIKCSSELPFVKISNPALLAKIFVSTISYNYPKKEMVICNPKKKMVFSLKKMYNIVFIIFKVPGIKKSNQNSIFGNNIPQ